MSDSVPPLTPRRSSRKRRNIKTVGNENGEGVDVNETLVVDEVALTIALAASTPQLLSLDNAQALVNYLDAGDVLECYLLTRKSFLHLDFGLNSTTWNESEDSDNHHHHRHRRRLDDDNDNPGTTSGDAEDEDNKNKIPVQTTALGLRYRPPPDSHKQPLTLTLEYGPNRKGRFNSHLSVPQVVGHESPRRVHWDNEGQVYFTTFIAPEDYSTASFLAVMTGAVLSDLLTTASLYPTHHRRYQPWQILNTHHSLNHPNDNTDGQQRLFFRSSSDYDFVHYLFKHLASVGVQLSPVLNPVVYRLQLSAVSVQRHTLTQEARVEMTSFYQKLYRCLDSLATATVLTPPPTPGPSPAPTISPAPTVPNGTDNPTSRPALEDNHPTVSPTESSQRRRRLKKKKTNSTTTEASTEASTEATTSLAAIDTAETTVATTSASLEEGDDNDSTKTTAATTSVSDTPEEGDDGNTTTSATVSDNSDGSNATETQQTTVNNTDTISNNTNQTETEAPSSANHSTVPSFQPSASPTLSNAPSVSWSPTPGPISNADAAAEAAAAAQEAANAAGEAGENPEQAAEAAQQAADAAQKAADATASQQAALRQEALFSGNAEAMTQTVNLCLSDPLYGIAPSQTDQDRPPTTLYLYWDSTYYYTVQVTAPFIQVVPVAASLPQPQSQPAFPEGSPLDWFLALLLVLFFLFSILLTSQHVLGRNFRIVPSLYKLQRWFFDPRNTHYDDLNTAMDEREAKGAGYMYTFGQDSIPRSMGGVVGASSYDDTEDSRNFVVGRPSLVPLHHPRPLSPDSGIGDTTPQDPLGPAVFSIDDEDDHDNHDEDLGDVELSVKRSSGNGDDQDVLSMSSGGTGGGRYYAKKKKKDPGLVALPDLKSRTKVAVPVSLQQSLHSSAGSSANGG